MDDLNRYQPTTFEEVLKYILFFSTLVFLCFGCENRNTKSHVIHQDSILVSENSVISLDEPVKLEDNSMEDIEDIIGYEWIKEYEEPEIIPELLAGDSTYRTFYYYKYRKGEYKVLTKDYIIIKLATEIDTTLTPLDGHFRVDMHSHMIIPEYFNSPILTDYFKFYPTMFDGEGTFKNGLKDGKWSCGICGGMNFEFNHNLYYNDGILKSYQYRDCPPPHKGEIPKEERIKNYYEFFFEKNIVHGEGSKITVDLGNFDYDKNKFKQDTTILLFNHGELVLSSNENDGEFDGWIEKYPDPYDDDGLYIYSKYKIVNNKKEGEWIISGIYEKNIQEVTGFQSYKKKNVLICNYKDDLLHGEYVISNFYKNIIPPPKDELKTVFYKTEFKNGTGYYISTDLREEGQLIEGKKNGVWKYFILENGERQLLSTGEYVNDKKHGQWRYYKYNRPKEFKNYELYYNGHLLDIKNHIQENAPQIEDFLAF